MLQGRVKEELMGTKVFVGVDVSKDNLDVAIGAAKDIVTFTNDQKGVDALVKKLRRINPALTVFESTGGYELLAASCCAVNPRQVRDFAKSAGILAKTDAIDARVIAQFAEAVKPDVWSSPQKVDTKLNEIVHLLKLIWGYTSNRRMNTLTIINHFNILKDVSSGFITGPIVRVIYELGL
jgi:transposase